MKIKCGLLLAFAVILSTTLLAKGQGAPAQGVPAAGPVPMTEKEVIQELKKDGADALIKDLQTRGVDFEMDADTEKRLRKAKASDDVIKAVTQAGPKEREAAAKSALASGALQLSPAESADFNALQSEPDPDKAIGLAEAYIQKYPKSPAIPFIYAMEANSYEQKGNPSKTVEMAEKSLELKPDNLMALLIVSYMIPTPQFINLHRSDEDKQLAIAQTDAAAALKAVEALKPGPNESDAAFAKRKATYESNLHSDLGMIHLDLAQLGLMGLDKGELAKAETEYRQAIALDPTPAANDYYRLGESCRLQGKISDAIAAFSKAADLDTGGVVKQYAERQIQNLKAAQAAAPAK